MSLGNLARLKWEKRNEYVGQITDFWYWSTGGPSFIMPDPSGKWTTTHGGRFRMYGSGFVEPPRGFRLF